MNKGCSQKNLITKNSNSLTLVNLKNEQRFYSLQYSDLSSFPWLQYISSGTSYSISKSTPVKNQVNNKDIICEENIKDNKEIYKIGMPKKIFENLSKNLEDITYESNPISIYQNGNSQFQFAINSFFKFISISNLTIDEHSLQNENEKFVIKFFVFDNKPLSELIQVDLYEKRKTFKMYSKDLPSITVPFLDNSYLIFIMYLCVDEEYIKPYSVGRYKIDIDKKFQIIIPQWKKFVPSKSIEQHIKEDPDLTFKMILNGEIKNEPDVNEIALLTANNIFYPSPLLTISNIQIYLGQKKVKKYRSSSLFLKISLRYSESGKELEKLNNYISPISQQNEYGITSFIPLEEHICFPDVINFLLQPKFVEQIYINFDLYVITDQRGKLILTSLYPICKAHGDEKIPFSIKGLIKESRSKNDKIRFHYIFPSITSPHISAKSLFIDSYEKVYNENDNDNIMNINLLPYVISYYFRPKEIKNLNFKFLISLFSRKDTEFIKQFIENYFSCYNGFTNQYIDELTSSLVDIIEWPFPFFLILLKAMCIENVIDFKRINDLLSNSLTLNISKKEKEELIQTISYFLVQLSLFFPFEIIQKITYTYISQLKSPNCYIFYKYAFSSISFIENVASSSNLKIGSIPISPYIPILSIYFKNIVKSINDYKKDIVQDIVNSIGILSSTIENYSTIESSRKIIFVLFPLLSLIFTYYDSFAKDGNNSSILIPIILIILKSCDSKQFASYFNLLFSDNQIHFFNFLNMIISEQNIHSLYSNMKGSNTDIICTKEITFRVLTFLWKFSKIRTKNNKIIKKIIYILLQLLHNKKQVSDSIKAIFETVVLYTKNNLDLIFSLDSSLLSKLINSIVPLTQSKLYTLRTYSTSFLIWIIHSESIHYKKTNLKSLLAIEYAIVDSVFKNDKFVCFFNHFAYGHKLYFTNVYNKLITALSLPTLTQKIEKLLHLAHNEYKDFASIRARIYLYIIDCQEKNKNYVLAFITQWRLCGLISYVFKYKDQELNSMSYDMPYNLQLISEDEPPLDISKFPIDSRYLVIESELFTLKSFGEHLQKALFYCQKADFHFLISQCTEYLFVFLEKQRLFIQLEDMYKQVSYSYEALALNVKPKLEFYYIFASGKPFELLGNSSFVKLFEAERFQEYFECLNKMCRFNMIKKDYPVQKCIGNAMQFLKLRFRKRDLEQLKINQLYTDVSVDPEKCKWEDTYTTRYFINLSFSLPSIIDFSPTSKITNITFTKHNYFFDKLKSFQSRLNESINTIKSVLPPVTKSSNGVKTRKQWGQCMLNLDTSHLVHYLEKIFSNETKSYYKLVRDINSSNVSPSDIPKDLWVLSLSILKKLIDCLELILIIHKNRLSYSSKNIKDVIEEYSKLLGVNFDSYDYLQSER